MYGHIFVRKCKVGVGSMNSFTFPRVDTRNPSLVLIQEILQNTNVVKTQQQQQQ
jgi:hypothetical protein